MYDVKGEPDVRPYRCMMQKESQMSGPTGVRRVLVPVTCCVVGSFYFVPF